jgi:hypothetical protein
VAHFLLCAFSSNLHAPVATRFCGRHMRGHGNELANRCSRSHAGRHDHQKEALSRRREDVKKRQISTQICSPLAWTHLDGYFHGSAPLSHLLHLHPESWHCSHLRLSVALMQNQRFLYCTCEMVLAKACLTGSMHCLSITDFSHANECESVMTISFSLACDTFVSTGHSVAFVGYP